MKVGSTQPDQLRICIGEEPALKKRIIGEVDTRNNMSRMEGDLLGFGKEVVRITVQGQLAHRSCRDQLFRHNFGRIEKIEWKFVLILLRDNLHAELPFGEHLIFDGIPEIFAMEVGIYA